jgi:hypothetical protein
VKILKGLIAKEKDAKRKYFYKFLERGNKVWRIKQTLRSLEIMVNRKIKQVLIYELKQRKANQ